METYREKEEFINSLNRKILIKLINSDSECHNGVNNSDIELNLFGEYKNGGIDFILLENIYELFKNKNN